MAIPKIISIIGPTASGKTACGIAIAKEFNGEVIAVDSRTVYRGMDIGTAKPEGEDRGCRIENGGGIKQLFSQNRSMLVDGVPHWGLDLVEPDEDYTVSLFQKYAKEKIGEIVRRGKLPILVGGTGLWMDAVVDNLKFPEVSPDLELRDSLKARTLGDLFHEYKQLDPEGAKEIDRNNKRRLIRALEVSKITGKPFSILRTKGSRLYNALWFGMDVDREVLKTRIDERVDNMVAEGLVDEVRVLKEKYGCKIPAMSGIGYKEICEFFEGDIKLVEAIENIKTNTRRFAKRQRTWFKRREEIYWVKTCEEVLGEAKTFLK